MRRFAWFDCFRFVAIFLVMLTHSRDISPILPGFLAPLCVFLHLLGWVGVELFFVLSGFLVSGLLFDEHDATGAINLQRFYIRRGFKIIPPFYFLTLVTVLYDAVVRHHVVAVHLIHDILFIQNYRMGAWPHSWTLAIEVHFYLVLGLLLWLLARHPPKSGKWLARLPGILFGLLVVEFIARYVNVIVRTGDFNVHRELQPTHLHLDVLAAGVLLRYLYTYHPARLHIFTRGKIGWIILGILLALPAADLWRQNSAFITALIPTSCYVGFGLLLFESTQFAYPTSGIGSWLLKPFDYLGKHSYSIYLWHLPVKEWIVDPLMPGPPGWGYQIFFFVTAFAVGCFFSEILEMPILHLRNKLFPSKARSHLPPDPGTKVELPPEEQGVLESRPPA